jgi:hypothetical protein
LRHGFGLDIVERDEASLEIGDVPELLLTESIDRLPNTRRQFRLFWQPVAPFASLTML